MEHREPSSLTRSAERQGPSHPQSRDGPIGERVTFQPDGRGPVQGMLTRYNRKSVTVVTDDGHRWTVSPALLSRATAPGKAQRRGTAKPQIGSNVISLK